jgi:hypothetical protein
MDDSEMRSMLQTVVDRQEIHDALMRYCRGADRASEELVNSAFHPEAVADFGSPIPAARLAHAIATGTQPQMMHFTGNVLIEFDGDTAYVESYLLSFAPFVEDNVTSTRTRASRYLDRFERREGGWKIAHRLLVDEWARLDELKRIPEGVGAHRGVRGPDDPVLHISEVLSASA